MNNRTLARKKAIRWARYQGRLFFLVGQPKRITYTCQDAVNGAQGAYFAVLRQTVRG